MRNIDVQVALGLVEVAHHALLDFENMGIGFVWPETKTALLDIERIRRRIIEKVIEQNPRLELDTVEIG